MRRVRAFPYIRLAADRTSMFNELSLCRTTIYRRTELALPTLIELSNETSRRRKAEVRKGWLRWLRCEQNRYVSLLLSSPSTRDHQVYTTGLQYTRLPHTRLFASGWDIHYVGVGQLSLLGNFDKNYFYFLSDFSSVGRLRLSISVNLLGVNSPKV